MCFKNTSELYKETSGIFMGVTTSRSKKDLQVNRDLPKSRKVVCSGLCWVMFRTIFLGEWVSDLEIFYLTNTPKLKKYDKPSMLKVEMKTKGGMRTILWLSFDGFLSSSYAGFMTSVILTRFDCARNSKTEVIKKTQNWGDHEHEKCRNANRNYRGKVYQ